MKSLDKGRLTKIFFFVDKKYHSKLTNKFLGKTGGRFFNY
jgi:hypothetical protein